jgi:hypothetical protein
VRNISSVFFFLSFRLSPLLFLSFPSFFSFRHLVKCDSYFFFMYVEAECYESRGMGTETHRETKRITGMGCCASPAAEPTPNCPFRRLGAKVLTAAWVLFPPPWSCLFKPLIYPTIHNCICSTSSRHIFFFYPWTCATTNCQRYCSNVNDNLQNLTNHAGAGPRHASLV